MLSFQAVINISVKTRIRYDGKEYSDVAELPERIRAAYEKATAGCSPPLITAATQKILLNGQEFASENELPSRERKLYGDVMSLIQDNGEVTLPGLRFSGPLPARHRLRAVLVLLGLIAFVALVVLAKTIP